MSYDTHYIASCQEVLLQPVYTIHLSIGIYIQRYALTIVTGWNVYAKLKS